MSIVRFGFLALIFAAALTAPGRARSECLEWIRAASESRSFVLDPFARQFVPWGFNYGPFSRRFVQRAQLRP
jgi:hypothetical protein